MKKFTLTYTFTVNAEDEDGARSALQLEIDEGFSAVCDAWWWSCKEDDYTKVVFLQEDGGVLAVFPETRHINTLTCYAHVGQHGSASVEYVKKLKPADDYTELKKELESIGYNLEVVEEV